MSYIDKTLLTGETVTYKAQVHWWVFVYPMKFLLFGLLLISFSSLYIKIPGYVLIAIALWGDYQQLPRPALCRIRRNQQTGDFLTHVT